MKILFIAKPLSKSGNGVVSALKNEILYLQKMADVALYNIGVELESDIADIIFNGNQYSMIRELPVPYNNPDIIVFEEVYKIEYVKLYLECIKLNIPYVIIPHGCLVEIEQNKKKLKHIVANLVLFNRFIKKAVAIQYLNEQEKNASKFECKQTIIIPNSIEYKERKYEIDNTKFKFIYVGRYDITVKGLDLLVDTFINIKEWCQKNNVILELYGPISENPDLDILRTKIMDAKCSEIIKINGPVFNDEKERKLQEASVFIQTSRNEGQPMGIIEALSFGMPCVVTYATSFGEYCNQNKCGIGVNFSQKELGGAIKEIYQNKEFLDLCRKNAVENMRKDFDIKNVAKATLEKYQELIVHSIKVK